MKCYHGVIVCIGMSVLSAGYAAAEPVHVSEVASKGAAAQHYAVSQTLHVGGEGRWDYVAIDPSKGLLYVPRQTHTLVLKSKTGEVVADLKDTPGVHGVAIALELNRGFTSNGASNSVTVFDLATNKVLGTIPTGEKPDAILFDSASKKVFVFDGKSQDVTVFDADASVADAHPTRIALEGAPEFAVSDSAGHVYVNLEDKSAVTVIDTKTLKVGATWKIEGGEEPSGLAVDVAHHRLYSGCRNQVMAVIDTESGKTLGTIPIGKGVDACAFDPGTNEAFASCGDGTLTVAKETAPGKFEVTQTVQTRKGARTMALDPGTHTIYLPTAEFPDSAPQGGGRPTPKAGSFMILVVTSSAK